MASHGSGAAPRVREGAFATAQRGAGVRCRHGHTTGSGVAGASVASGRAQANRGGEVRAATARRRARSVALRWHHADRTGVGILTASVDA
eukprot:4673716-Prymnesium_polylepis.1